jgi:hypothetical protein
MESTQMTFWDGLRSLTFSNEASVETDFILPLLSALGYERSDIRKNYPIVFQEGRRGRKHEADFVVFAEKPHNEHTSLLVIEAKSPSEKLLGSKAQAESYASNIRAPFLLLTNGVEIEIWQLQHTIKSELTLKAEVSELTTRRGEVERLISKAATIEYCRSLQHKKIGAVIRDFGRYEDAEIDRTSKLASSVERTLSNSNSGEQWTSTIIHNQFPEGALVLGASGFGKTTFARSMFRQAIATRRSTQKGRLPFDIPLPDLAISHHSTVGFMTARLAAHCPFVNEIILQQLLREEGASLVCDGFDRLSASDQQKIAADLRNLTRDFPKVQVFVFSRPAVKPNLPLEAIVLSALDDSQQYALAKSLDIDSWTIRMMPPMLRDLASHPLLLLRILRFYEQHDAYPTNLDSIFSEWLNVVVKDADVGVQQTAMRERAMSILAGATMDSPIDRVAAAELLSTSGIDAATFTELVACDALQISGSSVEVVHEALADYLRAKTLTSGDDATVLQRLATLRFEPDSFLPALVMERLPTRRLQQVLWRRLSHVAWDIFLGVLRFRGDTSKDLAETDRDVFVTEYLEDLLDGLELPLDSFFAPLRPNIVANLVRGRSTKLGVTGYVSPDRSEFVYGYVPVDDQTQRVTIGQPSFDYGIGVLDLEGERRRLDRARLVGMRRLQEQIQIAFANRALIGGSAWLHERLIGRLRYLSKKYRFSLERGQSLAQLRDTLRGYCDDASSPKIPFSPQEVSAQLVLDDIEEFEAAGFKELDLWWLRLGWTEHGHNSDRVTIDLVKEHFRRAQLIYFEVAQHSFRNLSQNLGFYSSLPVRWLVELRRHTNGISMWYRWLPVRHWNEVTVDVAFVTKPSTESIRKHLQNVETLRAELGRKSRRPRIFGASEGIPDFSGRNPISGRSTGETSAFWFACSLIQEDLVRLFEDLGPWKRVS